MSAAGRWRRWSSSSLKLGRPLFLEGEAGVGKTEIAKALAAALGRRLIRLQCYEGLDASSAVYEWNYPAQMIEIRLAEAAGDTDRELAGLRALLRALPDAPPAARGDGAAVERAAGPADRRDRPHRRALRGVPAGGAQRLPGDDPRARHRQGRAPAHRRHHLEPHARGARRAQAPLPLSLGRLPGRRARAGDPRRPRARGVAAALGARSSPSSSACAPRTCSSARRRRDDRLGQVRWSRWTRWR